MDASAVRFACREVTPNVMPSTATTSSAAARKTFAKSPNAGLIALVTGIGLVLLPVLVLVRPPLVAARVESDAQVSQSTTRDNQVFDDFGGNTFVPRVHAVPARRHVVDREGAVHARLRVVAVRRDDDVRHHLRVHVAV